MNWNRVLKLFEGSVSHKFGNKHYSAEIENANAISCGEYLFTYPHVDFSIRKPDTYGSKYSSMRIELADLPQISKEMMVAYDKFMAYAKAKNKVYIKNELKWGIKKSKENELTRGEAMTFVF